MCTLELVTVTDKTLISQNLNIPSLHVIYVQQLLNETGGRYISPRYFMHMTSPKWTCFDELSVVLRNTY